tara:strand:+ start:136 stop:348 length:213 start_codon:yes stop_codon:yes gene_type:complete
MKTITMFIVSFVLGAWVFSAEESIDNYYSSLDEDYPVLAAHQKMNNYGKDVMRKRAYKRKRMRRLPNNGK